MLNLCVGCTDLAYSSRTYGRGKGEVFRAYKAVYQSYAYRYVDRYGYRFDGLGENYAYADNASDYGGRGLHVADSYDTYGYDDRQNSFARIVEEVSAVYCDGGAARHLSAVVLGDIRTFSAVARKRVHDEYLLCLRNLHGGNADGAYLYFRACGVRKGYNGCGGYGAHIPRVFVDYHTAYVYAHANNTANRVLREK